MINQSDELPQIGLSAQIDNAVKARVMMAQFAHLHELNLASQPMDNLLVPSTLPPLDRNIEFAAGGNDPKRNIAPCDFSHLRIPRLILRGEVDIASKSGRPNRKSESLIEEINKAMQAMVRHSVGLID